jgi:O-antigen ligase
LRVALLNPIARFVSGSYITRDPCERAFARMHERDRIGDRIHLALACVCMALVSGPVSVAVLAPVPLVVFFFVRVLNTGPIWIHGLGQPVVIATGLLAGWMALSLAWSSDPATGFEMMGQLRWMTLLVFVYPVIERRMALIAALALGFVLGHGAQVIDAFNGFGNAWLADALWHEPERISGWWDPAVGGSVLVGALGLHLPGALGGKGRARWVALLGCAITTIALVATGTRGAWIAALVMLVLAIGARVVMSRRYGVGIALLIVVLVGAGVSFALVREGAGVRIDQAREQIRRASEGDLDSTIGARISMADKAIESFAAHPVRGVGAGGFRGVMETTDSTLDDAAHAHNQVLQWASELGFVGLAMGVLVVVCALVGAARWARLDPWSYRAAPLWGMIGLVLVSAFDSVMVNLHSAALFGALSALCPVWAPSMDDRAKDAA